MLNELKLRIPPLVLVALVALLMKALVRLFSEAQFLVNDQHSIIVGLLFSGLLIIFSGALTFLLARTTLDPRNPQKAGHLVTYGIYRISRNPIYLGLLLVLAAWALILSNWVAFICLPLYIVYMNEFQIKPEEQFMQQRFSDEYQTYKNKVRRWI